MLGLTILDSILEVASKDLSYFEI